MTRQADLIAYLFDGQANLLSGKMAGWMEASPRFTAFVETYRDKIRKKVRVTRDAESLLDLGVELEVACCLLNDRRLAVSYEPYASAKRRGPDFAVAYRANLAFNLEAARLRGEHNEACGTIPAGTEHRNHKDHIRRILLDKLGQMQPGMPNLLVILAPEKVANSVDLAGLMQEVKTRVEKKDPSFFAASRYRSPADFYRDFLRLSGVLLWWAEAQLWVNKQSRPVLDEKVLRIVKSLLSGAG